MKMLCCTDLERSIIDKAMVEELLLIPASSKGYFRHKVVGRIVNQGCLLVIPCRIK